MHYRASGMRALLCRRSLVGIMQKETAPRLLLLQNPGRVLLQVLLMVEREDDASLVLKASERWAGSYQSRLRRKLMLEGGVCKRKVHPHKVSRKDATVGLQNQLGCYRLITSPVTCN